MKKRIVNRHEINLDGKRVTYQFTSEQEQLGLDVDVEGWTQEALVLWIDRQVRQPDIRQTELLKWLSDLITCLINARNLHIAALMRCKFILARKIRDKVDEIHRQPAGIEILAPQRGAGSGFVLATHRRG